MSRFHETYRSIPPATLVAIGLCTTLFLIQEITFLPRLEYVTLCPRLVLYQGEVHRMLTSSLYHANWMHIGMNLLSTAAVGGILEKRLGTMRMFATILISLLVTPLLYISAALFLDLALGSKELMNKHAVGFSGIIFQLSVLECNLGPQDANRTLFGMFQVPAYLYPWAL